MPSTGCPTAARCRRSSGPAWADRGRPPAGYFTKRLADAWLPSTLDEARRGVLPGMVRTGATFADAAAEFLRYAEHDRGCKPSTLRDYRSNLEAHLLSAFGSEPQEAITPASIDRWRGSLAGLSNRTKNKLLVVMHGVFRRAQHVWGLPLNPVASVERHPQRSSGDIDVFSPEEVMAPVRAADSEQDAAIYLTAAFTGVASRRAARVRWRDVDFTGSAIRVRASYAGSVVTAPKSGKVRSMPMAPDVAVVLAKLGERERWTGDDDLVFAGELGASSASARARTVLSTRPAAARSAVGRSAKSR
jgi:integrase